MVIRVDEGAQCGGVSRRFGDDLFAEFVEGGYEGVEG